MGLWGRIKKAGRAVKKAAKKAVKKAKQVFDDVKGDVKEAIDEVANGWKEAGRIIARCTGALGCTVAVVNAAINAVVETVGAAVDLAFDAAGWLIEIGLGLVGFVLGATLSALGELIPGRIGEWLRRAGYWTFEGLLIAGRFTSELFDAVGGFAQRVIRTLIALGLFVLVALRVILCGVLIPPTSDDPQGVARPEGEVCTHSIRVLELEVVIIDKDLATQNPIRPAELDERIRDADRILRERAKIRVRRRGEIVRKISPRLYEVEGSFEDWLKGADQLLGRDNPRHLTVYAVGEIADHAGLHQPFFGSVFVQAGNPPTTLAHEIGHALLGVGRMGHSPDSTNLMFEDNTPERVVGWPDATPKLTELQWCSMRQSRWLNWSWKCDPGCGVPVRRPSQPQTAR